MATLTAAQARERIPQGAPPIDESEFDDAWVNAAVARHDSTFTRYRGESPYRATVTETVRPVGVSGRLLLRWPKIVSITSVTVDGSTLDSAYYYVDRGALARTPDGGMWYQGTTVAIEYVHGYGVAASDGDSGAPDDLKDACAWFLAFKAQSERTGAGRRSVRTQGPEFTSFGRADWQGGRPTGWDEVDDIWNTFPDLRMPGIA